MRTIFARLVLVAALAAPLSVSAQEAADTAIVQDYEPDPAVWLLQDEDTRIYLLGTVHILPEGFRWRSARIDGIVAEADELILESSDDEDVTEDPRVARLMGAFVKRPRVSQRLSPENGPKWLAFGESLGADPEEFDRMPPLLALMGSGVELSQQETGAEREFGVETVLTAEFAAAGKPIGAIESATDVLLSLLQLDEAVLIKELDRDLSRLGQKGSGALLFGTPGKGAAKEPGLAIEHRWAQGHLVPIAPESFGETTFGRSMSKQLLDRRNRAWAGWLEQRLAQPGTILVAVGAGHLAGRNSVQDMLAARGLAAERLD